MCLFLLFLLADLLIAAAAVLGCLGLASMAAVLFKAGAVAWLFIMALGGWGWLRRKKGCSNGSDTPY